MAKLYFFWDYIFSRENKVQTCSKVQTSNARSFKWDPRKSYNIKQDIKNIGALPCKTEIHAHLIGMKITDSTIVNQCKSHFFSPPIWENMFGSLFPFASFRLAETKFDREYVFSTCPSYSANLSWLNLRLWLQFFIVFFLLTPPTI